MINNLGTPAYIYTNCSGAPAYTAKGGTVDTTFANNGIDNLNECLRYTP